MPHIFLVFILSLVSVMYSLKGKLINLIILKDNFLIKIICFTSFFYFFSILFYNFFNSNGLKIFSFVVSFCLLFEICIKISQTEKFVQWIGENVDNSIRVLIMFVISLNCTYFFTRLTSQIVDSQGF
ncbi:MAG: hypothetical protein CMN01_02485 [Rickettsiales bacterium]|nr:hypothetical protein [Rickettsiales bacterium]